MLDWLLYLKRLYSWCFLRILKRLGAFGHQCWLGERVRLHIKNPKFRIILMLLTDSLDYPNPYANFFQFGTNSSVLVGGPYLVRSAELSPEGELSLRGDLETESMLTVIAELGAVRRVLWNGIPVDTMFQNSERAGVMRLRVAPRLRALDVTVPKLENWRYRDSLPEVKKDYDDAGWILANNTKTNSPEKPYFGDKVLYGCDYGLCVLNSGGRRVTDVFWV